MENLYSKNGIPFWDEYSIMHRDQCIQYFSKMFPRCLRETNPAWQFYQVEAPILTPQSEINENYTSDDVWMLDDGLVLRPETTPGSYAAAAHMLTRGLVKPPFVVWQYGKSFRREQDQVTKNMRLKEFYQMEFQCIYAADSANDYHDAILEPVRGMIQGKLGVLHPCRLVESDRLPSYSQSTMDVEAIVSDGHSEEGHRWMEVCSISKRTDFPVTAKFPTKKGVVEKDLMVLEVAIGLDRCVYLTEN